MSTVTPVAVCMVKTLCDATVISLIQKRPDLRCHVIDYSTLEASLEAKECKILLSDVDILTKVAPQLPKLEWVQSTWAGVETVFNVNHWTQQPSWRFTRMANYGPLLAEYVIGQIICWERKFVFISKCQDNANWEKEKFYNYRQLSNLVVSILGVGEIGKEIAKFCKQFGMRVHGLQGRKSKNKNLENFDLLRPIEELPLLLSECDYLVNDLPSTPETRGMLGNKILRNCQTKKAIFINIGRGDIVTENDLIEALDNNHLSGASLDVFETEPLPASSKLWAHPKVIITPHVAGVYLPELGADFFLQNLSRYLSGKLLLGEVDWKLGY